MNYNNFLAAMQSIETDRSLDKAIVLDALTEALEKAFKKHIGVSDALIAVRIDDQSGEIKLYRQFQVVEEVNDEATEIDLNSAQVRNQELVVGDLLEIEESVDNLGRPAALLAKNVLKQKIREAEKQSVYDEYITQLGDLITASIETVEEKFMIVNLGKTLALLPKSGQIPNERYYEGQKIRVVISEVNRDTKGAQILVSRSDEQLVRRLFEREIPEIYQGLVEIKAIARDAGERTKVAVYSKHEDVDALGACIGPGGARVHEIIDEIRGEKIDVFEWSDDIVELVRNALAPAKVIDVIPAENNRSILVVVEDNQLSLAIGKKGKNARLAVKLTGKKIDIKTPEQLEEMGLDYKQLSEEYQNRILDAEVLKKFATEAELADLEVETEAIESPKEVAEVVETLEPEIDLETEIEVETVTPDAVEEAIVPETVTEAIEVVETEIIPEPALEAETTAQEEVPVVPKVPKKRPTYVSKFERLADVSKTADASESSASRKRRKDKEEEDRRKRDAEIRAEKDYEIKPEYSEEELEEIRLLEEQEDLSSWIEDEIDFDEYDDFYD